MKWTRPLRPDLASIRDRLFGISPALCEAVAQGETSPAVAAAARANPRWQDWQRAMAAAVSPAETQPGATATPLPAALAELVRRRVAANAAWQDERIPAPGQIVEARRIVTPHGEPCDGYMNAPLYVLLDAPAETEALWHGWLVSGEADYAGWWDFVLQEEDGPFDPEAGMVQLWNPVRLYLPMACRVVARLSPARLAALRSLAADYVAGSAAPPDVPVWPGRVAARATSDGLTVVTGSPLGDEDDPRHAYQHVYFHAAEAVRLPARLALAPSATAADTSQEQAEGRLARLYDDLVEQARRWGETLVPQPAVAVAMRGEPQAHAAADTHAKMELCWPEVACLRLIDIDAHRNGGAAQLRAMAALDWELRIGGYTVSTGKLAPGATEHLVWEDEEDTGDVSLVLAPHERRSLTLRLAPASEGE